MEILSRIIVESGSQKDSGLLATNTRPDLFERVKGFLTISKEDRLRAGIYLGSEAREWVENSALCIPESKEQDLS